MLLLVNGMCSKHTEGEFSRGGGGGWGGGWWYVVLFLYSPHNSVQSHLCHHRMEYPKNGYRITSGRSQTVCFYGKTYYCGDLGFNQTHLEVSGNVI